MLTLLMVVSLLVVMRVLLTPMIQPILLVVSIIKNQ